MIDYEDVFFPLKDRPKTEHMSVCESRLSHCRACREFTRQKLSCALSHVLSRPKQD